MASNELGGSKLLAWRQSTTGLWLAVGPEGDVRTTPDINNAYVGYTVPSAVAISTYLGDFNVVEVIKRVEEVTR